MNLRSWKFSNMFSKVIPGYGENFEEISERILHFCFPEILAETSKTIFETALVGNSGEISEEKSKIQIKISMEEVSKESMKTSSKVLPEDFIEKENMQQCRKHGLVLKIYERFIEKKKTSEGMFRGISEEIPR